VLAGQHQRGWNSLFSESLGEGSKLDCFGPGPDDQPDVRGLQPSP
jgi:hypothetical protein